MMYSGLKAVFSTSNFIIVVRSRIRKAMNTLSHQKKHFFQNQSGLTLLEMAVVLIVIGVFLAGVIPKGKKLLDNAHVEKSHSEMANCLLEITKFLQDNADAITLTDHGKNMWSILKSYGYLPGGLQIMPKKSKDGYECVRLSNAIPLMVKCTPPDSENWIIVAGPMPLDQAKKWVQKIESATIHKEDDSLVNDISAAMKSQSDATKSYFVKIPILPMVGL